MKIDLDALIDMDPDDQDDAIREIAASMVSEGATEKDVDELQRLVDELNGLISQRVRPN